MPVRTGKQYIDGLKSRPRDVWLRGECIRDVTSHPAFAAPMRQIAKLYDMLPADVEGDSGDRTPMDNLTVRNVFVVGPDKKVKLVLAYPMTTGRNFDEVLRVIDSLQLTAKHRVSTPVNWKQGEDVIILTSVSDADDAIARFFQEARAVNVIYGHRVDRPAIQGQEAADLAEVVQAAAAAYARLIADAKHRG